MHFSLRTSVYGVHFHWIEEEQVQDAHFLPLSTLLAMLAGKDRAEL